MAGDTSDDQVVKATQILRIRRIDADKAYKKKSVNIRLIRKIRVAILRFDKKINTPLLPLIPLSSHIHICVIVHAVSQEDICILKTKQ
jgi:hypothetical protein